MYRRKCGSCMARKESKSPQIRVLHRQPLFQGRGWEQEDGIRPVLRVTAPPLRLPSCCRCTSHSAPSAAHPGSPLQPHPKFRNRPFWLTEWCPPKIAVAILPHIKKGYRFRSGVSDFASSFLIFKVPQFRFFLV